MTFYRILGTVSLCAFVFMFGIMVVNVNHFFDPVGGVSRLASDTTGSLSAQVRLWFDQGDVASRTVFTFLMVMQSICGILYALILASLFSVLFQQHHERSSLYLALALLFTFVEVVHLRHLGLLPNSGLLIVKLDAISRTMAFIDGALCIVFWIDFVSSLRSPKLKSS
jgi:hypothetical protein